MFLDKELPDPRTQERERGMYTLIIVYCDYSSILYDEAWFGFLFWST